MGHATSSPSPPRSLPFFPTSLLPSLLSYSPPSFPTPHFLPSHSFCSSLSFYSPLFAFATLPFLSPLPPHPPLLSLPFSLFPFHLPLSLSPSAPFLIHHLPLAPPPSPPFPFLPSYSSLPPFPPLLPPTLLFYYILFYSIPSLLPSHILTCGA